MAAANRHKADLDAQLFNLFDRMNEAYEDAYAQLLDRVGDPSLVRSLTLEMVIWPVNNEVLVRIGARLAQEGGN